MEVLSKQFASSIETGDDDFLLADSNLFLSQVMLLLMVQLVRNRAHTPNHIRRPLSLPQLLCDRGLLLQLWLATLGLLGRRSTQMLSHSPRPMVLNVLDVHYVHFNPSNVILLLDVAGFGCDLNSLRRKTGRNVPIGAAVWAIFSAVR